MSNEKLPPHDIDAEEAVLGSLLIDGTTIYQVTSVVQPHDFYSERNLLVYEACCALYERNEAINQITVAHELARRDKLETCGGAAYLSHLIANCPSSLDIEHYAQIVYRLSVMRNLIRAADQIAGLGYQGDPDIYASLNKAEDILFKLRRGQGGRDFIPIRQLLDKYIESSTTPATAEGYPPPLPHLLTGFAGLDDFVGGFKRSDLIVLAARPSMGKTSLALNIARNASLQYGACVAMFSLEMASEALVSRLVAGESGVNSRRFQFGLSPEEERRVMEATGKLAEAHIYIDDSPQLRVAEMRGKARRLSYEREINLIIVDHLGLMQGDYRIENRVQEISYISRSLKAVARELNVPVLAVSQLSRATEWRAEHRPQLSDLRDSGSIEQDADVVLFIYRDEYYSSEEEWKNLHPGEKYPPPAELIIAKHRNGPTGEIQLNFRRDLAKFENIGSEEPSLL